MPLDLGVSKHKGSGNTGAALNERLANPIVFEGNIKEKGADYIIVDDVFTSGNTVISMAEYIREQGGNPIVITTLAASKYGVDFIPSDNLMQIIKNIPNFVNTIERDYGKPIEYFTGSELQALSLSKRGSKAKDSQGTETDRGGQEKLYTDRPGEEIRFSAKENSENELSLSEEERKKFYHEEVNIAYGSAEQRADAVAKTIQQVEERPLLTVNSGLSTRKRGSSGAVRSKDSLYPKVQRRSIIEGFRESGYVDFNGLQINSPQDIADLWAIHRSPFIEKAHVIFAKDGEIVGSTATTLNAKIKAFRSTQRGVRDVNFFLFRLTKIYA